MSETQSDQSLPTGCRLDDYVIDRKLGGGGFSIVYLAHHAETGEEVVIKEYMPRKLAYRDEDGMTVQTRDAQTRENFMHGQRLFFQEASTLATIKHANIVEVNNFFRANGTVYMVMAYERGINLQDYIRRHNGGLSEELIRTVFPKVLDGLKLLHTKGLLHLDIKPGNIYLRAGGNPVLLDFGAVHQMQRSRKYQATQVITPGFAPVEQKDQGGYVGPWTDIYAIGATIRTCMEGCTPPPAEDRRMDDPLKPATVAFRRRYSYGLLEAVDWAMEVDPLLRPQSVDEFLGALEAQVEEPPEPPPESMLERLTNSLPWTKG